MEILFYGYGPEKAINQTTDVFGNVTPKFGQLIISKKQLRHLL